MGLNEGKVAWGVLAGYSYKLDNEEGDSLYSKLAAGEIRRDGQIWK
jgi:hypothetical protein